MIDFNKAMPYQWPFEYRRLHNILDDDQLEECLSISDWNSYGQHSEKADIKERIPAVRKSDNRLVHYFTPDNISPVMSRFKDHLIKWAPFLHDAKESYLRMEVHLDTTGYVLEPHTDNEEKLFTLFVYLNTTENEWEQGTDLYESESFFRSLIRKGAKLEKTSSHNLKWSDRVPYKYNSGMMFVPCKKSWHGYTGYSDIKVERRALQINFISTNREGVVWPLT